MKSDGRTVPTTMRTPPRMNTEGPSVTVGKENWHPVPGRKSNQLLHGRDFLF